MPRGLLHVSSPPSISPEWDRVTSRSVLGDRRQAMQASMASCQGSNSASGNFTSRIRILGGEAGEGRQRKIELARGSPVPFLALTTRSPQHGQVQGLVGGWSIQALHQCEEGLGLPLELQHAGFDLIFLGSVGAEGSLQIHKELPGWAQALHQTLQGGAGTLRRGFFCYRNRGVVRIG